METSIRLQKFMADQGIASRRKCEELILNGKVKVNGKIETRLGTKVNPEKDKIEFNNKQIKNNSVEKTYILLNKPIGYVTTVKDQFNRNSVLDLVKTDKRLVPVGRLDMYTSGALILTNDGKFVYMLTHPKHEVEKTYVITIDGKINDHEKSMLEKGVIIKDNDKDYKTRPAKVKIKKFDIEKNQMRIEITIHEGKNRQIRKMLESLDKKVIALHRSKIGQVEINGVKIGEWRYLTNKEIEILKKT